MKVSGLAASVLTGALLLAVPGESHAASRFSVGIFLSPGYDHSDRYVADTFRIGYERGVQEGYDRGRDDGRHHDRFDFWREKRYRCGDSGYHRSYGPKDDYVRGYREGFERGYRRAYARFAGYYNDGHYQYRGDYDNRYDDHRYDNDRYDHR